MTVSAAMWQVLAEVLPSSLSVSLTKINTRLEPPPLRLHQHLDEPTIVSNAKPSATKQH